MCLCVGRSKVGMCRKKHVSMCRKKHGGYVLEETWWVCGNALFPYVWADLQGVLCENDEYEPIPAIIPINCTVFGGILHIWGG